LKLLNIIECARCCKMLYMVASEKPSIKMEEKKKPSWIDLINESVHTSDDVDIGDIDAVSRDFIVVKRGFVNIHYYYIPIG
jgi:hypothetical protein